MIFSRMKERVRVQIDGLYEVADSVVEDTFPVRVDVGDAAV